MVYLTPLTSGNVESKLPPSTPARGSIRRCEGLLMLDVLISLGVVLLGMAAVRLTLPSLIEWNRSRRRVHHRLDELRRDWPEVVSR